MVFTRTRKRGIEKKEREKRENRINSFAGYDYYFALSITFLVVVEKRGN